MWHLPDIFLSESYSVLGDRYETGLGSCSGSSRRGWVLMGVSLVGFRYTLSVTVVKAWLMSVRGTGKLGRRRGLFCLNLMNERWLDQQS